MVLNRTTSRLIKALLLTAALGVARSQDDPCVVFDEACAEDSVCSACKETPSSNTAVFEQCVLNYGYSALICVNQAAQPCCQAVASSDDCLANEAYVSFYDCRLQNDVVGEECPGLNCDALGTPAPTAAITSGPTPVGGPVPETEAPTSLDAETTTSGSGRQLVPMDTYSGIVHVAIALTIAVSAAVGTVF